MEGEDGQERSLLPKVFTALSTHFVLFFLSHQHLLLPNTEPLSCLSLVISLLLSYLASYLQIFPCCSVSLTLKVNSFIILVGFGSVLVCYVKMKFPL